MVGTYRLLRQDRAEAHFGFYSSGEYDLAPLLERHPGKRFLELGRSCVLKPYRTKRTVELLWHGIWTYVLHHRIDAMLGCASLEGTDPRIGHLRHVEAHEAGGRLRDAEDVAGRQHQTLRQASAGEDRGVLFLGQAAPQGEAAPRHDPGLDAERFQPGGGLPARPRQAARAVRRLLRTRHAQGGARGDEAEQVPEAKGLFESRVLMPPYVAR